MTEKASKPATPEAYLALQSEPVRQRLEAMIDRVRRVVPGLAVSVSYDILKLSSGRDYLYLAGWKQHIGVYPIYPDAGALEPEVAPYRAKKDTLQFRHDQPLPLELVEKLAASRFTPS